MQHPLIIKWKTLKEKTNACLCIGLDPDISKLPIGYPNTTEGMTHFLKDIIDITHEHCIAYKPNISFFEAYGLEGLKCLETIISHINQRIPVVLDAKRGDIGNTSKMQAKFIFDYFGADATTLHPYMGTDSLTPFFDYKEKYHFVLGLTSNPGAADFEKLSLSTNTPVYQHIINTCQNWYETYQNIGVVVGATQDEMMTIRKENTSLLFLIPGVGTQGGTYQSALTHGRNDDQLALINVSRAIIYAAPEKNTMATYIPNAIKTLLNPV